MLETENMADDHATRPITVFYSYSHKDERAREQLESHLGLFNRGRVSGYAWARHSLRI